MPFVGNTHHLQNTRTEAGRWFTDTVSKINSRVKEGQTSQGFYVVGADGSAYVFNNNRGVERVLEAMARGEKGWKENPPEKVEIAAMEYQPKPPAGATILRVYSRIKPVPAGCDAANENVQRDHLWILREEVAQLKKKELPENFKNRLLRFAFVDAIRGEPDFWQKKEIRKSDLRVSSTVPGVYKITGSFAMSTADNRRGLEGTFEAELKFADDKLTQFDGFAQTTAWGQSTYTPNPPAGKFPLKFAFLLTPAAKDTVAPQATFFGQEYISP